MDNNQFLYLIKTIEDGNVQIVAETTEKDGVLFSEGKVCAVLKRYTPPIDMSAVLADLQHYKIPQIAVSPQINKANKVILDHLGNQYESVFQMCNVYGVTETVYRSRIKNGWSVEEALSGKKRSKEAQDHLGNQYGSVFQMCSVYGVSETVFKSRVKNGWTLEEALTGVRKKVFDHLGNAYSSKNAMCQHYGIPYSRFCARIKAGCSIEEALSGKIEEPEKNVEDHLGNKYVNISQMCQHYGIRMDTYCHRRDRGWSLEEILTGKKQNEVFDHKGNKYACLEDMCQVYEVSPSAYKRRITTGWTVEEALLGIREKRIVKDHLGNAFPSVNDMCRSYGIKLVTFRSRLKHGWSLEQALTTDTYPNPYKIKGKNFNISETVVDHLGKEYESINQMCNAYGISKDIFINRRNAGFSLEQALTGKSSTKDSETNIIIHAPKKELIIDHLGKEYNSLKDMCDTYGIRVDTYKARRKLGYSIEKALTRIPSRSTTGIPCEDHLGNHYSSGAEMARAYGLTKSQFIARKRMGWSIEKILTTPMNADSSGKPFVYEGKSYSSIKEFCRIHGVRYDTFHHRLKKGYSIEEAIDPKPIPKINSTKRKEEVTDHNGIRYNSIEEMCATYNQTVARYKYRLKNGWSQKDALLVPRNSGKKKPKEKKDKVFDLNGNGYPSIKEMCKQLNISLYLYKKLTKEGYNLQQILEYQTSPNYKYTDHKGNRYTSLKDMCKTWHVSVPTYKKRIATGCSIEEALTNHEEKVVDYKGNEYPTIKSMCAAYNVSVSVFISRIRRGKSLKEALETPKENNCIEYNGVEYESMKALAKAYNVNRGTFSSRLKLGWTIDEAISGVKQSRVCYDHLGKMYSSQKEMCDAYNVQSETFHSRIKAGWSLRQALLGETPVKTPVKRKRRDHLGNYYPDLEAMCNAYGINVSTYQKRVSKGMSIEEALTSKEPIEVIMDHKGNEYSTLEEMCKAYNISKGSYYYRIRAGKDLETVLEGEKQKSSN